MCIHTYICICIYIYIHVFAVPGRSLRSGLSLCGGFAWRIFPRRIFPYCRRIFVADFRGGFPRRILRRNPPSIWVNHAADFAADFCLVHNPVNYMSKSHRTSTTKIHRNSSPHARLVCDCTLPVFFTACFAACPSTGILHYVTYTADFFRGGFCAADFCAADFCAADFRGGFLLRGFRWPSVITHQTWLGSYVGYREQLSNWLCHHGCLSNVFHLASVLCHVSDISKQIHA